jgi:hypothetical protein
MWLSTRGTIPQFDKGNVLSQAGFILGTVTWVSMALGLFFAIGTLPSGGTDADVLHGAVKAGIILACFGGTALISSIIGFICSAVVLHRSIKYGYEVDELFGPDKKKAKHGLILSLAFLAPATIGLCIYGLSFLD